MTTKPVCINYIEFNVENIQDTKDFFGTVFGWTFKDYGPEYCEFSDGQLKGGFCQKSPNTQGGPLVILYTDKLEILIDQIQNNGGKISKPIFPFPGGRRFHFQDPNGYELAVWSDK